MKARIQPWRWDHAKALARFEHLLGKLTDEEAQRATHGEWVSRVPPYVAEVSYLKSPEEGPDRARAS